MPVSEPSPLLRHQAGAARVLYAMLLSSALLLWLNQDSVRQYCQQKYHDGCELPGLGQSTAWRTGAYLSEALGAARVAFVESLSSHGQFQAVAEAEAAPQNDVAPAIAVAPVVAPPVAKTLGATPAVVKPAPVAPAPRRVPVAAPPTVAAAAMPRVTSTPLMASLNSGDEVFFVGDSLMQGVAPHMANTLRKRYNLKSVNLSRQSTGLAYPSFFNWPKTVQSTLQANPRIRLMVVFLGPNDPWDMPQGKGKPFLRFKTPDWENLYRQRIDAILDVAQAQNVQVIWVGPPNMQKTKLSDAMAYLSDLYKNRVEHYGQHYVSANEVLGYTSAQFSYYLTDKGGKQLKTRVDDGIHFTITGQKLISAQVLSRINFPSEQLTEH